MKKVSVVTVCYNVEKVIRKTLDSVLNQKYLNFEYYIKDGHSTDATNKIIDGYKKRFEKKGIDIQHCIGKDCGIYDAMNYAIMNCTGEWVIFMNAGDAFYNEFVLKDVFDNKRWDNIDAIYGYTFFDLSNNRGIICNHNINFLEQGWSLGHQSVFLRRTVLRNFLFDCKYSIIADYEQIIRIKKAGYKFYCINSIISEVNRDGISNKKIYMQYTELNMLKKIYNLEYKHKSLFLGRIKQYIQSILPCLERMSFVKNVEKRNMKFK